MKNSLLLIFVLILHFGFAQNKSVTKVPAKKATVKKTSVVKQPKVINQPLPHDLFFQLIDSVDAFVIDNATQFQHVDVPKRMRDKFNAYVKDSTAAEVPGLKSLLYYNYTLLNGRIIIGDIYWNDKTSYIVFKIYDKKYVNYFTKEGVEQLRTLFKL